MTITRRGFLRGFAGALITLPVLEACKHSSSSTSRDGGASPGADAASAGGDGSGGGPVTSTPAKRFIAIMAPNGVVPAYWFPTGDETSFTLNKHGAPYAPIQDRLVYVKGVDNDVAGFVNGHVEGVTSMLTGRPPLPVDPANNQFSANGVSIDQVIARAFSDAGYVAKVPSVHFNEEGGGPYSSISYADINQPMDMNSPRQLFDLLFENPTQTAEAIARARARKKSLLDGTIEDFTALSRRVSGEDKVRIDAHLEAVRDIERRLVGAAVCSPPTVNLSPANDDETRTLYYDLLVAAMTCDATRVATVSFRHSGGGGPQLPFIGVLEDIHELSHQIVGETIDGPAHQAFDAYHRWYAGKILYMVQKMQTVLLPDGKSLFDETVLLQGSEISVDHGTRDMPFLLIAGAATPVRAGRYVQLPNKVPHNHLLVSIARACGLSITGFGDPAYAEGNLDAVLLS